jgi:hypothetical protein
MKPSPSSNSYAQCACDPEGGPLAEGIVKAEYELIPIVSDKPAAEENVPRRIVELDEEPKKAQLLLQVVDEKSAGQAAPPKGLVRFQDYLPTWGYDAAVGKYADDLMNNKKKMVRMQACVGPAIFWAKLAVYVFWPSYFAITAYGLATASCTDTHAHLWMRIIYGLVMIFRLGCEFRCLKFVTIPYVQTLRRFQWMSVTVPFAAWVAITGVLSITNMMDQLTDSLFVISSRENLICWHEGHVSEHAAQQSKVHALWQGYWKMLNMSFLGHFHYADVAMFIWSFTLLQAMYPIFECTPRPKYCNERHTETEYTIGSEKTKYRNLVGKECNLGDTVYQLADATGMASLAVQQPEYPRVRERMRREEHKEDFNPELSLSFLQGALSEGMCSVGLVGALENTPQVIFQSVVFELTTAVSQNIHSAFAKQTMISLSFSCLMCMTKLWKTAVLLSFFAEVRRAIQGHKGGFSSLSPKASKMYLNVLLYAAVLIVWALLLILGVFMASCQVHGSIMCHKDELWLVGNGCLKLADIAPGEFSNSANDSDSS